MTQPNAGSRIDGRSTTAALFAGVCNLLSLALRYYQIYVVELCIQHRAVVMNYPYPGVSPYPGIVFQSIFLTPLLVVILFRRIRAFLLAYAFILSLILTGRIYYLVQFYRLGVGAVAKFDWADLLSTFLQIVSVAILAIWATVRVGSFISNTQPGN